MFRKFINRYKDTLRTIALVPGALLLHAVWPGGVGVPMMVVGQLILLSVQVIAFILWLQAD